MAMNDVSDQHYYLPVPHASPGASIEYYSHDQLPQSSYYHGQPSSGHTLPLPHVPDHAQTLESALVQSSVAPPASAEQPFYVNAKQYHRILKRRIARAKLEESLKLARGRRPYLHESRHKHAMRRPRGQGGRFLTAQEIAEQKKHEEMSGIANGTPAESLSAVSDDLLAPIEHAHTPGNAVASDAENSEQRSIV